jgi:hypothetical protein
MDFQNKNDYSVYVFYEGKKKLFTEYVHNIYSYSQWLYKHKIDWHYLLVYVRRSRQVLCYYKNGDFINAKPTFESRGRVKNDW